MAETKILVAEDNLEKATMIRMILEAVGHTVTCVENGQAAVDAAAREAFDLILMDVMMPVMDGLAAIRQIRHQEAMQAKRPCRIYTVTANRLPADVGASFDAGADGHISKPFGPGALLDALASVGIKGPGARAAALRRRTPSQDRPRPISVA